MVFSSTIFLFLFLPLVLIGYYNPIIKSIKYKNIFLLCASLLFYAWGEPFFVFLMILSIFIAWIIGLKISGCNNKIISLSPKAVLSIGIGFFVFLLFIFKYLTFCAAQLGLLLNKDLSMISISLPIGISFFSFQLMSYLFDVYYKKAEPQKNIFYLGLYVSLFPQLIAGPIVRYQHIAAEIVSRKETMDDICEGMKRFIVGLGKKVILANYLAQIADNCFDGNMELSVAMAWLGAIAYTLQIYFDFSGYSDMAIGLGRMFGFHFAENFNYPYIANSITDFWRRWHISLSSWFRDYVYIPMGGNRVSKGKWIFNLFAVWALTGIWHGANYTFLIWGLFYFLLLLLEKITGFNKHLKCFSYVYTIVAVIIAWVIFRSPSMGEAFIYIQHMFAFAENDIFDEVFFQYTLSAKYILLISIICAAPIYPFLIEKIFTRNLLARVLHLVLLSTIYVLSLLLVISSSYNPFIYFNF